MRILLKVVTASSRNSDSTDSCIAAPCTAAPAPPTALWKRGSADGDAEGASLGAAQERVACADADGDFAWRMKLWPLPYGDSNGDSNGDGEADGLANAETECEVDNKGECAGQELTLSVGADAAGGAAGVVGPRALPPFGLGSAPWRSLPPLQLLPPLQSPSTERDGAEELWLTRPLTPRDSRRVTTGGAGGALGGETREVMVVLGGKVLRRSWAE